MTARIDLAGYLDSLTRSRDEAHKRAVTAKVDGDSEGRRSALVEWGAYALAISSLHTWTGGQFGTPYQEQPSPYAADSREGVAR